MKKFSSLQLVLIFAPFVFSFAFGLDIYIPVVPQMTSLFKTTPSMIQLTLSLYLLCTGFGQLIVGPLADRYGRKPLFYLSSLCFAVGSLACAIAPTIVFLILARILSSFGACGMLVSGFATVRDSFQGGESAKMYSFLNGAIGVSPIFAPIIGGYLAFYFGWQSIFIFLCFIGLLGFIVTHSYIEETNPKENRLPLNKKIFSRYWQILCNREFLVNATLAGFAEGIFFGFFSTSPFILIEQLGIKTEQFGYYFSVFGCAIAFGGILSGKFITKERLNTVIYFGLSLVFAGGLSMLLWHYLGSLSVLSYLLPMLIACSGAMFLLGAAASGAMEPFGAMAGTASAMLGAFQFGISALIGSLVMLFETSSTLPYALSIVLVALLSVPLLWWRRQGL